VLNKLLSESGKLQVVKPEEQPFAHQFRFLYSDGHTPGLMLSEIQTPKGSLVFASDLIPGSAWVHVPLSMGYDRFPELVIDEKKALLEKLFEAGGSLFFTHDSSFAFGKVQKSNQGRFSVLEAKDF
jgi:glyoxylase-like metal-dependent hydrolase (beta-lactamase superfamily II)